MTASLPQMEQQISRVAYLEGQEGLVSIRIAFKSYVVKPVIPIITLFATFPPDPTNNNAQCCSQHGQQLTLRILHGLHTP